MTRPREPPRCIDNQLQTSQPVEVKEDAYTKNALRVGRDAARRCSLFRSRRHMTYEWVSTAQLVAWPRER